MFKQPLSRFINAPRSKGGEPRELQMLREAIKRGYQVLSLRQTVKVTVSLQRSVTHQPEFRLLSFPSAGFTLMEVTVYEYYGILRKGLESSDLGICSRFQDQLLPLDTEG